MDGGIFSFCGTGGSLCLKDVKRHAEVDFLALLVVCHAYITTLSL